MDEERQEFEVELNDDGEPQTINININVSDPVVDNYIKGLEDAMPTTLFILIGIPIIFFLILAFLIML